MSTPELEALLEQAIAHVNAGELEQGRDLLERVLEQDPKNDRAWVWMSGCVEEPMQRRICLQQALSANPNNQAALDGMQLLDGELVKASELPPSLLESRLSAIGMSDQAIAGRPAPAVPPPPAPEAATVSPVAPVPFEFVEEQEPDVAGKKPGGRRIVLVVAVVLLLFLVVCVLVATQVVPILLGTLL